MNSVGVPAAECAADADTGQSRCKAACKRVATRLVNDFGKSLQRPFSRAFGPGQFAATTTPGMAAHKNTATKNTIEAATTMECQMVL